MMLEDENRNIEQAMRVVMRHKKSAPTDTQRRPQSISQETLKVCLVDLANIVEEHGDVYLLIFERVQNELLTLQKQNELKHTLNHCLTVPL